ncbi:unnamed protein product [Rangifer tarandus platyrhynchus]|uniref:Secreted protein n=1 Tax=Rangifer tarandus platyrhynchus TaxID=3082113 RepID=A0ABN8XIT6_RANTA|nr:unnamed protein product [Rangifer tarandus platyrhynchus]
MQLGARLILAIWRNRTVGAVADYASRMSATHANRPVDTPGDVPRSAGMSVEFRSGPCFHHDTGLQAVLSSSSPARFEFASSLTYTSVSCVRRRIQLRVPYESVYVPSCGLSSARKAFLSIPVMQT